VGFNYGDVYGDGVYDVYGGGVRCVRAGQE
jgi:hypothetical protein